MRKWIGLGLLLGLLLAAFGCDEPMEDTDGGPTEDASATCGGDSECDDGVFCNGAEQCEPANASADAAGCVAGETADLCATTETCDAASDACVAVDCSDPDLDDDGDDSIACGGADCDDTDASRSSTTPEVCDAADVDEDCNASTFGSRDMDGDGFVDAECCNGETCGDDCDDSAGSIYPGNSEACDGLDNDCDTLTDEGVLITYYLDRDSDSAGDPAMTMEACGPSGLFTATVAGDCNDLVPSINPGAPEVCDAQDNDCNPATWAVGEDDDEDGFLNADCGGDDCDDDDPDTHPGAAEPCTGFDNNCSGDVEDADGDGSVSADADCTAGPYDKDDCEDTHPGANRSHTQLEPEPYCPNQVEPCLAPPLRGLRCRASNSDACTPGLLPASYDWDCSGTAEREAARVPMCNADCSSPQTAPPGGVCDTLGYNNACIEGPNYSGTPACGSTVSYEACCCDGSTMGSCNLGQIFDDDRPLRCR